MSYWGNHPAWLALSPTQRAAAMALLEARAGDTAGARNVLGSMINRASLDGRELGDLVSSRLYQPTMEPAAFDRFQRIVADQPAEFGELTRLADDRLAGRMPDWVQGATHFLAPEQTMLTLEAQDPQKYRSWRDWTGFDPSTRQYQNVVLRDRGHAFLAPEGRHSASFSGDPRPHDAQAMRASAPTVVTPRAPTVTPAHIAATAPPPAVGGGPIGPGPDQMAAAGPLGAVAGTAPGGGLGHSILTGLLGDQMGGGLSQLLGLSPAATAAPGSTPAASTPLAGLGDTQAASAAASAAAGGDEIDGVVDPLAGLNQPKAPPDLSGLAALQARRRARKMTGFL